MSNTLKIWVLTVTVVIISNPSFAWRDDWDWPGSGRDHPYSYYVDNYYDPPYAGYLTFDNGDAYLNYINDVPALPPPDPGVYTVNVPNNHGGYTPVVIKRSGNGFTGPQGEYYPAFPSVAQLKVMYGQ